MQERATGKPWQGKARHTRMLEARMVKRAEDKIASPWLLPRVDGSPGTPPRPLFPLLLHSPPQSCALSFFYTFMPSTYLFQPKPPDNQRSFCARNTGDSPSRSEARAAIRASTDCQVRESAGTSQGQCPLLALRLEWKPLTADAKKLCRFGMQGLSSDSSPVKTLKVGREFIKRKVERKGDVVCSLQSAAAMSREIIFILDFDAEYGV
ncbi:hypothetical protein F4780DRAFT_507886 [Xylariomycetidae sp. FL0641]|nr:hypothetical protein F4780DRAFT_507886 [Xylariomycetidae sp. FL0641]